MPKREDLYGDGEYKDVEKQLHRHVLYHVERGDLVVVDVGGATSDVYSVLSPDPDAQTVPMREVAGTLWRSRTVEGDLGMRWSATGVVQAAAAERLLVPGEKVTLGNAGRLRADDPSFLPVTETDRSAEARIAQLAATIALRRHARGETRASAKDLRRVRLLIGSGGVLRHASRAAEVALRAVLADHAGGWALPRAASVVVDLDYVLAPAGLLAVDYPKAAAALLRRHLAVGQDSDRRL